MEPGHGETTGDIEISTSPFFFYTSMKEKVSSTRLRSFIYFINQLVYYTKVLVCKFLFPAVSTGFRTPY
jgi:hypothetical protein